MQTIATPKMPTGTIKDYIVSILREDIITGRLRPGDRVNESRIARDHEVSRIPVREALQVLHEQGLLMSSPRRGMFVNELDEEDSQKINNLRIILESEAIKLCRVRLTSACEKLLTSLVDKMEEWDPDSEIAAAALDLEFHQTIWANSGNIYLERSLNSVVPLVLAHQALEYGYGATPRSKEVACIPLKHHRELLQVVQGRSSFTPEQAMLRHLKLLYTNPERFSSFAAYSVHGRDDE